MRRIGAVFLLCGFVDFSAFSFIKPGQNLLITDRKGSKIHKMRNEEGNSAARIAFK